jgi:hypothetical protein
MSPFCESAKMAVLPLNKFPCSKTAPPLPETTVHVLTSLPSPFYKSHWSPRLGAAPSFPQPAWQFGPDIIKLCSMDVRLFSWAFFVSSVFPNIWCRNPGSGWVSGTDLALPASLTPSLLSLSLSLSLSQFPFPSSRIWAALPGPQS